MMFGRRLGNQGLYIADILVVRLAVGPRGRRRLRRCWNLGEGEPPRDIDTHKVSVYVPMPKVNIRAPVAVGRVTRAQPTTQYFVIVPTHIAPPTPSPIRGTINYTNEIIYQHLQSIHIRTVRNVINFLHTSITNLGKLTLFNVLLSNATHTI